MRAGRLDKKINIAKSTFATSTLSGEQIPTWSTFISNRWASIEPLSGAELFRIQQINHEVTTRITMRYSTGISPQMKIIHGESTYLITSIIDPELKHKEIQMICSLVTT